ncbi:ImmA/IrrE family metallo-endopeptidase [Paenibacillus algicola]|uniref:ImmA/IrrE family metallo-endopeptidase n=1 Tax=Paenibacillus algicola TaxID=2565926 RepID=UPI0010FDB91F|nr:ImmA/IrrE family metallo-endopeptidase [Paenibacillus algicola]
MIKHTVTRLIKKHGTNNPFEIASQRNIIVLFEELGDMLGYYNTYRRVQLIHINSNASEQEQRFTCAHELGHSILHPTLNTPFLRNKTLYSIDRIEREANLFAIELLMPDELLHKESITTLREAALTYGVPEELIELKTLD